MPIIGSFGSGSGRGFGKGTGGKAPALVHYLLLSGGGGGGAFANGGGGGGGGLRTNFPGGTELELKGGTHTITVGAGGNYHTNGSPSSIGTTIESTGGGGGQGPGYPYSPDGGAGSGSSLNDVPGGIGNLGGYSPPEGAPGAARSTPPSHPGVTAGGGGGGGGPAGAGGPVNANHYQGYAGSPNAITGSPVTYAGGGGAGAQGMAWIGGSGGSGGGGNGSYGEAYNNTAGTDGLGGGGGGGGGGMGMTGPGSPGGDGKIILRAPTTTIISVTPGSNTISTQPDHKLVTFNVSGTLDIEGGD